MVSPTTSVSVLWSVWLAGWLLSAGWTARTVSQQAPMAKLAHSALIVGGAALLFLKLGPGFFRRPLLPNSGWIGWGGVALVATGLGFAAWARVHLGRFWSGDVTLKEGHAIVRTGPYALTRHPIYTGLLLAVAGTALVRGTLASLAGLFLFVLGVIVKSRQEEQLLIAHFGDAYRSYQDDVSALIPRPRWTGV